MLSISPKISWNNSLGTESPAITAFQKRLRFVGGEIRFALRLPALPWARSVTARLVIPMGAAGLIAACHSALKSAL
jgi:hypothetical protein